MASVSIFPVDDQAYECRCDCGVTFRFVFGPLAAVWAETHSVLCEA